MRAGESISWNSKSNQLYWTLGPELYQADVDSQYLKKNAQTKPSIINVGFTEKADVPRGTVAFVGGKVITMENDQVIDKGVVIVKDNHIVAVGDANTAIPKDAQVIDISGKLCQVCLTLTPMAPRPMMKSCPNKTGRSTLDYP